MRLRLRSRVGIGGSGSLLDAVTDLLDTLNVDRTITTTWTNPLVTADKKYYRQVMSDDDLSVVSETLIEGAVPEVDESVDDPFDQVEYLRPRFTLPAGLTFNELTGDIDGEVVDTTYIAPTGTVFTPADSAALATALASAVGGDVIRLTAGVAYTGPFTIPNRGDTDWLLIETDATSGAALDSTRPAGTRVTPADRALMPELRPGSANHSVFAFANGAHHVRFRRLNFTNGPSIHTTNGLVDCASASAADADDASHHIIFDQCVSIPTAITDVVTRAIYLDGFDMAVIDSYLYGFYDSGIDSQAVAIPRGGSRFTIRNNRMTSGSENFATGGGSNLFGNPTDIEVRRCYLKKPSSWSTDSDKLVKNAIEMKGGVRVLVEDCILEGVWADAQAGWAAVFWSVNQNGTTPESETSNLTMRFCRIIACGGGFQLTDLLTDNGSGSDYPAVEMHRVHLYQITMERMDEIPGRTDTNARKNFQILAYPDSTGIDDLVIENISGGCSQVQVVLGNPDTQDKMARFEMRNCVIPYANLGFFNANGVGDDALDALTSGDYTVDGNVVAGEAGNFIETGTNQRVATTAALKFTDFDGGDLSLQGDSPAKGAGTDGRDAGADVAMVLARTAGVEDDDYEFT